MNGTLVALLNSLRFGAYPSVGVNAVWMVIALLALLKVFRPPRSKKTNMFRRQANMDGGAPILSPAF